MALKSLQPTSAPGYFSAPHGIKVTAILSQCSRPRVGQAATCKSGAPDPFESNFDALLRSFPSVDSVPESNWKHIMKPNALEGLKMACHLLEAQILTGAPEGLCPSDIVIVHNAAGSTAFRYRPGAIADYGEPVTPASFASIYTSPHLLATYTKYGTATITEAHSLVALASMLAQYTCGVRFSGPMDLSKIRRLILTAFPRDDPNGCEYAARLRNAILAMVQDDEDAVENLDFWRLFDNLYVGQDLLAREEKGLLKPMSLWVKRPAVVVKPATVTAAAAGTETAADAVPQVEAASTAVQPLLVLAAEQTAPQVEHAAPASAAEHATTPLPAVAPRSALPDMLAALLRELRGRLVMLAVATVWQVMQRPSPATLMHQVKSAVMSGVHVFSHPIALDEDEDEDDDDNDAGSMDITPATA